MRNAAKKFNILAISLSVLYKLFWCSNKIIFRSVFSWIFKHFKIVFSIYRCSVCNKCNVIKLSLVREKGNICCAIILIIFCQKI